MDEPGSDHAYPPSVCRSIRQNERGDYLSAAHFINDTLFDAACLQHEFGIFGGDAGSYVLSLIDNLNVPLVSTLHTILDQPNAAQRRVMDAILCASTIVVVMADKGREILIETYGADPDRIEVIAHGIPDVAFEPSDRAKKELGFGERKVILTFGLLGPGKGIETMIEAMPDIVKKSPDAIYVIMGATHPQLLRSVGDTYRDSLVALVRQLGLDDHVVFLNRFADRPDLLEHISMCDVYVTPYTNVAQMTSGTLAYSHGQGRPVVSTPYWHAAELLADGSGVLVPFADPARLGRAVSGLLEDDVTRHAMGKRAYAASRARTWPNSARRYVDCFRMARRRDLQKQIPSEGILVGVSSSPFALPKTSNRHLIQMCDDTGIFQHAIYSIPDRQHGYCIDDNARGLLLCCMPFNHLEPEQCERLATLFSSFIQHGWNPDNGRFRNFMAFNRQWLEPFGSEDSHGRTLWALGACAADHRYPKRVAWAAALFGAAISQVSGFTSPRAWAFTLLGLDYYCGACPDDQVATDLRADLALRLSALLRTCEARDWVWFESRLTYDNARLCEALLRTGKALENTCFVEAGLRSLHWLAAMQTAPAGHFRPVGSEGFMLARRTPQLFDQQPLEAAATIAACAAADSVDRFGDWQAIAQSAFSWFLGENDLGVSLVDVAQGVCSDGLHPDRVNENCGAESSLAYLMGLADMRKLDTRTQRKDLSQSQFDRKLLSA